MKVESPGQPKRYHGGGLSTTTAANVTGRHAIGAVSFDLCERDQSHVDEAGMHVVAGGQYRISVGGGQPGTEAPTVEAPFTITGRKELPR